MFATYIYIMSLVTRTFTYWFGSYPIKQGLPDAAIKKKWFMGGPQVDAEIKDLFKNDIEQILKVKATNDIQNLTAFDYDSKFPLSRHGNDTEALLALLLCVDQFTRNIYRNSPNAFSGDRLALSLADYAVRNRLDLNIGPAYRQFFYLPFEHDESRKSQLLSVALASELVDQTAKDSNQSDESKSINESCKQFLEYAKRHKIVIDLFGRFPHRNEILGRTSTKEETEYLESGGDRF